MSAVFVDAIAVIGPGLRDWDSASDVLRDPSTYASGQVVADSLTATPANERRRTTPLIRLPLEVMDQLQRRTVVDLSQTATIFATAWGDLQVIENMMRSLVAPGIPVSPVQFHNMVHNAPAGYWSIGAHAQGSSTSLTAGEETFVAGLTDALASVKSQNRSVLYVCYEYPGPGVFKPYSTVSEPFAVAMLLAPARTARSAWTLTMEIGVARQETTMAHPGLEDLRRSNPAARSLPLLQATATGARGLAVFSLLAGHSSVVIDVVPLH